MLKVDALCHFVCRECLWSLLTEYVFCYCRWCPSNGANLLMLRSSHTRNSPQPTSGGTRRISRPITPRRRYKRRRVRRLQTPRRRRPLRKRRKKKRIPSYWVRKQQNHQNQQARKPKERRMQRMPNQTAKAKARQRLPRNNQSPLPRTRRPQHQRRLLQPSARRLRRKRRLRFLLLIQKSLRMQTYRIQPQQPVKAIPKRIFQQWHKTMQLLFKHQQPPRIKKQLLRLLKPTTLPNNTTEKMLETTWTTIKTWKRMKMMPMTDQSRLRMHIHLKLAVSRPKMLKWMQQEKILQKSTHQNKMMRSWTKISKMAMQRTRKILRLTLKTR